MKKWGIVAGITLLVFLLYYIEINKIDTANSEFIPTLDELKSDDDVRGWDAFYRVRATIIDGQTADFSVPKELKAAEGGEMILTGAAVFFGNGCKEMDEGIAVSTFYLLPTPGYAEACEVQPDVSMRWTIMVNLENEWVLSRTDMVSTMAKVSGTFRIDTKKPYEAAFFLDNATAELTAEE